MISQKQIFILHTFLDVTAILLNPLGHILAHIQNHNMLVKSFAFCSLFLPSEQSRHTSGKELQAASPHMFFPRMIRKYLCGMKTRQKKNYNSFGLAICWCRTGNKVRFLPILPPAGSPRVLHYPIGSAIFTSIPNCQHRMVNLVCGRVAC